MDLEGHVYEGTCVIRHVASHVDLEGHVYEGASVIRHVGGIPRGPSDMLRNKSVASHRNAFHNFHGTIATL